MRNYFIIHAYAVLVFLCIMAFLRIALGKPENTIAKITGEESGTIGLEVIEVKDAVKLKEK